MVWAGSSHQGYNCRLRLPAEKQNSRLMKELFTQVAPRYDFVTRIFSYGMDLGWKKLGVDLASPPRQSRVLDLACGTGDFSKLVLQHDPEARTIAADLTPRMLRLARTQGVPNTVCADATCLPFADRSFDAVFIGYGLRNFPNLNEAVHEVQRVTRPGGLLVSLDFFLPGNAVLRKIYLLYLFLQGAFWGMVLHGRPRVYTYIPDSLRSFVSMDEFSSLLRTAGYAQISARPFIFGGIALHRAQRS